VGEIIEITKIGWECPVCHAGLSPDVEVCYHGKEKWGFDNTSESPTYRDDEWDNQNWYEQE
jgi:hypothetical protein